MLPVRGRSRRSRASALSEFAIPPDGGRCAPKIAEKQEAVEHVLGCSLIVPCGSVRLDHRCARSRPKAGAARPAPWSYRQLRCKEAFDVRSLAGERRSGRGPREPRRLGVALLDGPSTRCCSAIEYDGFEHPAAPQDVMVVLGDDEWLARAGAEHGRAEG